MRNWLVVLVLFGVLAGSRYVSLAEEPLRSMRWGVDDAGSAIPLSAHPKAKALLEEFGFNFLVSHHHYRTPKLEANRQSVRRMDDWCREMAIEWVANLESPNFVKKHVDETGRDWYNRPDGRHFFLMPEGIHVSRHQAAGGGRPPP